MAYTLDLVVNLTSVLGGQQLLWTEQLGLQYLDSIVWPLFQEARARAARHAHS
jgi:hypothetical protein